MRKRFIYTFLYLIPGFFVSLLITCVVFGIAYAALWLYVFGDRTRPAWTDSLMPILILIVFFGIWASIMVAGYVVGKRLESVPGFDVRHVWLSLATALLPIGIALLYQSSIGHLGLKTDSQRCGDYCKDLGYRASSITPRHSGRQTCSCLGRHGEHKATVPITELPP